MLPLKCDLEESGAPLMTVVLIALCVVGFVYEERLASFGQGFVPLDFIYSLLHPGQQTGSVLLSLGASFFLHAGIVHLLSNMWYLWIFGGALEAVCGARIFVFSYLLCGALSMIVQALSTPYSQIPVVGASGAIAGVMGAVLVLRPLCRLVIWLPPFFFIRLPSLIFLLLWFALQYYNMHRAPLSGGGGGVAWWAHIGGFLCGFVLALELLRRGWGKGKRRRKVRAHV
jgi:membrane associated rhomboid family serine protease